MIKELFIPVVLLILLCTFGRMYSVSNLPAPIETKVCQ
jgi:hypothetical protein